MHVLAALVVLVSLIVWQRRVGAGGDGTLGTTIERWWPLLGLAVVGFGVKEDLVVLPIVLVMLTWLRARLAGGAAPRLAVIALGAIAVSGALAAGRYLALGTLGGYSRPSIGRMWTNFGAGIDHVVRQVPADRPWQLPAGVLLTTLLLCGIAASFSRRARTGRYLIAAGLTLLLVFNLPFALVTKQEQYHLLIVGAVIALGGAVDALRSVASRTWMRQAVATAAFLVLIPMALVARHAASDFAPCSSMTLSTDALAAGWYSVPTEIKEWLARKAEACRSGSEPPALDALPVVTWGAYDTEYDERGRPWRWTSGRVVALIGPDVTSVRAMLRDPTPESPALVTVRAPGDTRAIRPARGEWQYVDIPTPDRQWTWRPRRVVLWVSPTFVPAEADPRSTDRRALGVQIQIGAPSR
jgi:hypothetical protein